MVLAVFGQIQCIILIVTQTNERKIMAQFSVEIADADVAGF